MELTEEQTLDMINSAISWGHEVAEMWTGTQYEKQIEAEISRIGIERALGKIESAKAMAFDLAQFLDQAEREYERADELQKSR